jgi:hypothetical protein
MSKIVTGLVVFSVCLVAGVLLWLLPFFRPGPGERVLEKWESQRGKLKIVVTARPEEKSFVPGAYYSFEAVDDSNSKREIMTFRHDDPVPINKDGIVFVNDDIAYVFMGWQYAVTTDRGKSWQVWSAEKDLPGWKCCNYRMIQEVRLSPDGTGTMKLNPIPNRQGEVPELVTKDFGRHWTAP